MGCRGDAVPKIFDKLYSFGDAQMAQVFDGRTHRWSISNGTFAGNSRKWQSNGFVNRRSAVQSCLAAVFYDCASIAASRSLADRKRSAISFSCEPPMYCHAIQPTNDRPTIASVTSQWKNSPSGDSARSTSKSSVPLAAVRATWLHPLRDCGCKSANFPPFVRPRVLGNGRKPSDAIVGRHAVGK